MVKLVHYPMHLLIRGITKNDKGLDGAWQIAAGDTETINGPPNTLQLCFDGERAHVWRVTPQTILPTFMAAIDDWADRVTKTKVCFFHNLRFDLQALLYDPKHRPNFSLPQREFSIECDEGRIQCYCDKTWFAKVYLSKKRTVWLIDSRSFFPSSLRKAAELVQSPYLKLDQPKGLGETDLTGDPEFESYIRHDVLAQWYLGKAIFRMHEEYDVRLCVSRPHFASRVFRHKFLEHGESIPFPPVRVARAAEFAYHGGKNAMPVWVKPGWHQCTEYDINSAYTWAMTQLPSLMEGKWFETGEVSNSNLGFYKIAGRVDCPWNVIFTHDFKPVKGRFADLWVTGYEIVEALRTGCLQVESVFGYVWEPKSVRQPFADFAMHFFEEKARHPKGSLPYVNAKLNPNSIYGKTVCSIRDGIVICFDEKGRSSEEEKFKASGFYNPVIGSAITGMVRAKLHRQEHACRSLHSSTDSIKSEISERDVPDFGKGLGQWSKEIEGSCLILRPKLYYHLGPDSSSKPKVALHGFRGSPEQLLEAAEFYLTGREYRYLATQVATMRQSLARREKPLTPLKFEKIMMKLAPPV